MNAFSALFLNQYFLPGLFFVLWSIVSWGWPVVSVILLPFFFSFYFGAMKFPLYGVPFTLIEWMVYVTFLTYIIRFLLEWMRSRDGLLGSARSMMRSFFVKFQKREDIRMSFWIPIGLILLGLLLGFFQMQSSEDTRRAFGILKEWFVVPVLYFYLMQKLLPGLKSVRRCFEWYTISAVFLSMWGIAQFFLHWTTTPDGRVSGPFESANYLALYIMPAVVFVLIRLWHLFFVPHEYIGLVGLFRKIFHVEDRYSPSVLLRYIGFGLIMLFALYLTRSFGAFLGLFVAFFGYITYHWLFSYWRLKDRKILLKITAAGAITVIIAALFFATGDPGKFKQMFNFSGQSSSSVRLQVWTVSLHLIDQHPILGIGAGRFEEEYARGATTILGHSPYEKEMLHPHNIFLMFWLSAGIFGLIGFLWLIILLFVSIARIEGHDGRKRLALICGVMLVAILVHGLVDTPIWKNDLALIFWMIAGAVARLRKIV